MKGPKFICKNR